MDDIVQFCALLDVYRDYCRMHSVYYEISPGSIVALRQSKLLFVLV